MPPTTLSPIPKTGVLHATFWMAVTIRVLFAVAPPPPATGQKMPAPRVFAAVFVAWFILGLVAELGRKPAKIAGALSLLIVLAMLMGNMGNNINSWLKAFGAWFSGGSAGAIRGGSQSSGSSGGSDTGGLLA